VFRRGLRFAHRCACERAPRTVEYGRWGIYNLILRFRDDAGKARYFLADGRYSEPTDAARRSARHNGHPPREDRGTGAVLACRVRRHHRMPVSQLMLVRFGRRAPTVTCVSGHLGRALVLATWITYSPCGSRSVYQPWESVRVVAMIRPFVLRTWMVALNGCGGQG
jgi:hypothetical protein